MKNLKNTGLVIAIFLCICFMSSPAWASPSPDDKLQDVNIESTLYLASWGCDLTSSGTITGFSEAIQAVDKIWVKIYLQKWNGTTWVDITSGDYRENQNSNFVSIAKTYNLSSGYYRVRAEHQCIENGTKDPSTPAVSFSDYLYIK
ncbi:hypothetical protein [Desulfolucanica intricata]|uniref:hypothetical protein n=1 Tax=Desulfolucanica intricata TaxID=1285191 RepID=UPI0008366CD0|nr:hypothetical protein [Desulfolucanica intricata]